MATQAKPLSDLLLDKQDVALCEKYPVTISNNVFVKEALLWESHEFCSAICFPQAKIQSAMQEADILTCVQHPLIPHLIGHNLLETDKNANVFLLLEPLEQKNLQQMLKSGNEIDGTRAMQIVYGISSLLALLHCQTQSITGSGLTTNDIFFTRNKEPKLIHFQEANGTLQERQDKGILQLGRLIDTVVGKTSSEITEIINSCFSDQKKSAAEVTSMLANLSDSALTEQNCDIGRYRAYVATFSKAKLLTDPSIGKLTAVIIEPDDYELIKKIRTKNQSCQMSLYRNKHTNEEVVWQKWDTDGTKADVRSFRQPEVLCRIQHPAIIKLIGYDRNRRAIVFDGVLATKSLQERYDRGDVITDNTTKMIFLYGIASAIATLHDKRWVHRNISPDTIYIDQNGYPVLAGFFRTKFSGVSFENSIRDSASGNVFQAPELASPECSEKADIYSYGMWALWLLRGQPSAGVALMPEEKSELLDALRDKSDEIPGELYSFLVSCTDANPKNRPTASDIRTLLVQPNCWLPDVRARDFKKYVRLLCPALKVFSNAETIPQRGKLVVDYLVNLEDYEKKTAISSGAYACVFMAVNKKTRETVAMKEYSADVRYNEAKERALLREIEILVKIVHPVIVRLLGHNLIMEQRSPKRQGSIPRPTIILEYLENGTLKDLISHEVVLSDTVQMKTLFGLASALKVLHKSGVVHRDLKPDNIMFDSQMEPRLVDFNQGKALMKKSQLESSGQRGSEIYAAPEAEAGQAYDAKMDIYSFGMVAYALISKQDPFRAAIDARNYKQNPGGRLNWKETNEMTKYIDGCVLREPKKRPTAAEVVEWLKQHHLPNTDKKEFMKYVAKIETAPESEQVVPVFSELGKRRMGARPIKTIEQAKYTIKQIKYAKDSEPQVLKELNNADADATRKFVQEMELLGYMFQFPHPAILKGCGTEVCSIQGSRLPAVFMPYMENGNLTEFMKMPNWNATEQMLTLIGVASAILYFHREGMVLRHLCPSHVLFDKDGYPHVTGLGHVERLNHSCGSTQPLRIGKADDETLRYSAPEIDQCDKSQMKAVDIYSFGVIAYLVLSGRLPYEHLKTTELIDRIRDNPLNFGFVANPELQSCLSQCVSFDPNARPSAKTLFVTLFSHDSWIDGCDSKLIKEYAKKVRDSLPGGSATLLPLSPEAKDSKSWRLRMQERAQTPQSKKPVVVVPNRGRQVLPFKKNE